MARELEQAGIAAYLPGMRLMLERMQAVIDEYYARLEALQNGEGLPTGGARPGAGRPAKEPTLSPYGNRIGRPPDPELAMQRELARARREAQGVSKYNSWANLSPAEYERRRQQMSEIKKAQRADTAAYGKSGWAGMTPQERSVEMKRRMALWDSDSHDRRKANLRGAKVKPERAAVRTAAAKKAAAVRWGKKTNGQAALSESQRLGVSPQKLAWMRLTPQERAARVKNTAAKVAQAQRSSGGKVYWAKLTPEERSREMARRNKVRAAKRAQEAQV